MDPFVQAARRFSRRCAMFWKAGETPVLRVVAPLSARGDVVSVLQWQEAQVESRRPLVLVTDSPSPGQSCFEVVIRSLVDAYSVLRAASIEAGVPLPVLDPVVSTSPVVSAVQTAERFADNLPERLDGIVVAIVPHASPEGWDGVSETASLVKAVMALRTMCVDGRSPRVQLLIHDAPNGPLAAPLGEGVPLDLDEEALFAWWRDRDKGSRGGDEPAEPTMRARMVEGIEALRTGEHDDAIAAFQGARDQCAQAKMPAEEAALLLAIGGVQLTGRAPSSAVHSYRRAAEIATEHGSWSLACQARLGQAGAELLQKRRGPAAVAYTEAAALAEKTGAPELRDEASRLAKLCDPTTCEPPPTCIEDTPTAPLSEPPEAERFATAPIPIRMPQKALPFARGAPDTNAIDAWIATTQPPDTGMDRATEQGTMAISSLPVGAALPFETPENVGENATRPVEGTPPTKITPFSAS